MAKKTVDASSSAEVSPEIAALRAKLADAEAVAKAFAQEIRAIEAEVEAKRIEARKAELAPQIADLQAAFDALSAQLEADKMTLSVVKGDVVIVSKRARRSASKVYEWVTDDGEVWPNMQAGLTYLNITEAEVLAWSKDVDNLDTNTVPKHHTTCYTCLRTKAVYKHFGLRRREVKS